METNKEKIEFFFRLASEERLCDMVHKWLWVAMTAPNTDEFDRGNFFACNDALIAFIKHTGAKKKKKKK